MLQSAKLTSSDTVATLKDLKYTVIHILTFVYNLYFILFILFIYPSFDVFNIVL